MSMVFRGDSFSDVASDEAGTPLACNGSGNTTEMTVAAWVKFTTVTVDNVIACRWINSAAANQQWRLRYDTSDRALFEVTDGTTVKTVLPFDTPSAGVWYCVVGRQTTAAGVRIFRDGTQLGFNDGSTVTVNAGTIRKLEVGKQSDLTAGYNLEGKVAAVAVWNIGLTDAEIAANCVGNTLNVTNLLALQATNLKGLYVANASENHDYKAIGANLTLSGATYSADMPATVVGVSGLSVSGGGNTFGYGYSSGQNLVIL